MCSLFLKYLYSIFCLKCEEAYSTKHYINRTIIYRIMRGQKQLKYQKDRHDHTSELPLHQALNFNFADSHSKNKNGDI